MVCKYLCNKMKRGVHASAQSCSRACALCLYGLRPRQLFPGRVWFTNAALGLRQAVFVLGMASSAASVLILDMILALQLHKGKVVDALSATKSLVWIIFFLLASIAMLVFVPRRDIMRLLPFGIVGGFAVAMLIQVLAVWYLRLWRFNFTEIASIRGIPIFLAMSWLPLMVIFAYWLLSLRSGTARFFYIAAYALATVAIEWGLIIFGYQVHRNWNILYAALLALVLHYLLGWYLLATRPPVDERKVIRIDS